MNDGARFHAPGSEEYARGTQPENLTAHQHPAFVAFPETADDVSSIVLEAAGHGLGQHPRAAARVLGAALVEHGVPAGEVAGADLVNRFVTEPSGVRVERARPLRLVLLVPKSVRDVGNKLVSEGTEGCPGFCRRLSGPTLLDRVLAGIQRCSGLRRLLSRLDERDLGARRRPFP